MAVLCRQHKLLFIMVPATGCSSIGDVLRRQLGGEWIPAETIRRGRRTHSHKHNTISQLLRDGIMTKAELDGCLKFATIRNPYDRLASEYERLAGSWMEAAINSKKTNTWFNRGSEEQQKRLRERKLSEVNAAREAGFAGWLRQILVRDNRADWKLVRRAQSLLRGTPVHGRSAFPMIDGVDEIIRFESLEEDFNRVLEKAGIKEHVPIPHSNVTPGKKPYQEYYTPELQRLVERYVGDQLAEFGYTLEQPVAAG